jgi:transcriptional regulator with XRE-family HTH domain
MIELEYNKQEETMYEQRLRHNLRPVIERHGVRLISNTQSLESISGRHIWNIEKGIATITVKTLEAVADEIGADMLEFFEE